MASVAPQRQLDQSQTPFFSGQHNKHCPGVALSFGQLLPVYVYKVFVLIYESVAMKFLLHSVFNVPVSTVLFPVRSHLIMLSTDLLGKVPPKFRTLQ